MKPILLLFALIVVLNGTGCEGPTGPEGPQGERGMQGEEGPQGPPGEDGTANVFYSEWVTFEADNWSDVINYFGQSRRQYPVDEPRIDAEILSHGTVMIYVRFSGTHTLIEPLPILGPITKTTTLQILNFRLEPGFIFMTFYDLGGTTDPGRFGSGNQYRYIIIPGGVPLGKRNENVWENYYTAMQYLGIDP